jgi:hypothetical protein
MGKRGPQKGATYKPTITKAMAREEARLYIQQHMPRMITSQVEAACGVAHLMLRNEDGTWAKAPANMTAEQMLEVLNGDQGRYYIATKDPNTQAFNTLTAYALDKPKEQEQEILVRSEVGTRLETARLAAAARNKNRQNP